MSRTPQDKRYISHFRALLYWRMKEVRVNP